MKGVGLHSSIAYLIAYLKNLNSVMDHKVRSKQWDKSYYYSRSVKQRHIPVKPNKWAWGEFWGQESKQLWFIRIHRQLFRERLSEKVHTTIPKGIAGDFEFTIFSMKFERMAQEAMGVRLQALKEGNKSSFDSDSVRNSVLIMSHITSRDCRMHIFSDNLSQNSCIL